MKIFTKTNRSYILLLSLLALGLLYACSSPAPPGNPTQELLSPPYRVDVLYFYKGDDCHCQEVVGDNINATLFINFNGELISGKLTFQSLNLDDQENATIAYKYGAVPVSLFLNIVRADNEYFVPVPEILLVQDDDEALDKLVNTRIRQALDGEK